MGKTYTSNYNLTKDDENEFYNVAVQSENMDLIDGALKALSDEKVSHIEGKGLSTNDYSDAEKQKLAKIPEDAIDYQHPATHSLDMITETGARKIFSSAERTKLSGIDEGANNYTHPSSHSLDMITETAAKKIMTSAERSKLSGIQSGAQVNSVVTEIAYSQYISFANSTGNPRICPVATLSIPVGDAKEVYVVLGIGTSSPYSGPSFWAFRNIPRVFCHSMDNNSGAAPQWQPSNLGFGSTIVSGSNAWRYSFSSVIGPTYYIYVIDCYFSGTNLIIKLTNYRDAYSATFNVGGYRR